MHSYLNLPLYSYNYGLLGLICMGSIRYEGLLLPHFYAAEKEMEMRERERKIDRERERDRQTDRQTETERLCKY